MPSYETTIVQREQLAAHGFTLLPSALPPDLLARWRRLADRLEEHALSAYQESASVAHACVVDDPTGPRLVRFDDVLGMDGPAVLDLLSCPAMMAIARELCGRGAVPLQVDILFKHQHPHSTILWHQGAPHARSHPYLNIGIYLDDADAGDGCVKYVPATQHELQDICMLSEEYGWNIPGSVECPARAGDILVQDMMVLHGSGPKRSPGVRRTIYVEMRPSGAITEDGAQSERWAELRRRWMGMVVRRALSADWPSDWQQDLPLELGSDAEEIADILALSEPPIPSVYCHFAVETADYPIPADLRSP